MKIYQQITLLVILSVMFGVYIGISLSQFEYERRAEEIVQKECYTNQDLELILFNEIQE